MKQEFPHIIGEGIPVPIHNGSLRPYINLDNAATTAPFSSILNKIEEIMQYYGSVHRGSGYKSKFSTNLYEHSLDIILRFADGDPSNDVLVPGINATDCLNHLARRIKFAYNEVVIVSNQEHSSNYLPWKKATKILECNTINNGDLDLNHLEELLKSHKVRIVSVTGASNISGKITDTAAIATLAHKYGAEICVDASQLAGHRKLLRGLPDSMEHIDYLIFSGHKMYAPFGVGVLIGNKKIFTEGWPDKVGGGSVKWIDETDIIWSDLPQREVGGTPNFVGVVALAEACRILNDIGFENLINHENDLVLSATKHLLNLEGLEFLNSFFVCQSQLPIFTFTVKGYSHSLVGAYLGFEKAIGVRTGLLCQFNRIRKFLNLSNVDISNYKSKIQSAKNTNDDLGIIRASCGIGNTTNDIILLADALSALVKHGTMAEYQNDAKGNYVPVKGF